MKVTHISTITGMYLLIKLEQRNVSITEFAKKLGLKRPWVNNRLLGKTRFTDQEVRWIVNMLNIPLPQYNKEYSYYQSLVYSNGVTVNSDVTIDNDFFVKPKGNKTIKAKINSAFYDAFTVSK